MTEKDLSGLKKSKLKTFGLILILVLVGFTLGLSVSAIFISQKMDDLESRVKKVIVDSSSAVYSITASQTYSPFGTPIRNERTGSGVVFRKSAGYYYLITNFHVVENARQIKVVNSQNKKNVAELVGSDPLKDIAVLKFKTDARIKIPYFSKKLATPGTFVIAIGSPFQFDQSATLGIVSANQRSLETKFGYWISDIIQTDAPINPGNSGGPLLNLDGEVVGINTAIFSTTQGFEGLGFAIPASTAKETAMRITEEGELARKLFGITCADFDKTVADSFHLPVDGVLILCLDPNSPLGKAGLKPTEGIPGRANFFLGDIITAVNGQEVTTMEQLSGILSDLRGKDVGVTFFRNQDFFDINVKVP